VHAFVLCCLALVAPPHEGAHAQIAAVTREIAARPDDGRLYLRRAELQRQHGAFEAALDDVGRAEVRDAELGELELVRGRALAELGQRGEAERAFDRLLARSPDHAAGLRARGALLEARGALAAAERDLERAIAAVERPRPEDYLARARVARARGEASRALAGLDEGLARLGPVVTLELLAIELELELGRHDAALARIARIERQTPRKETWLARRGDVLERAGRRDEARRAWRSALEAIARLPQKQRRTRAVVELEAALRERLAGKEPR
jgi:tetratricopeptide (TPR) repeat protein